MIRKPCIAGGLTVAAFIAILTMSGFAQSALATLRGTVLDEQGGALPGATVTVRQVETNTVQTAVAGSQGQYFLPNLRPGSYEVTSDIQGFASTRQQLELRVGQDLTVNLTMKVGGVAEAVQVVGQSIAVETQSTIATIVSTNRSTISPPSRGTSARSPPWLRAPRRRPRPAPARARACRSPDSAPLPTASSSTAPRTRCSFMGGRRTTFRRTGFRNSRCSRMDSPRNTVKRPAAC